MGSNIGWLAPLDPEDQQVYILSGDIVKNFQMESFDGNPITEGGETLDGKMKFDYFPIWRINRDDIRLIDIHTVGDDAFIRYRVAMTNKINIYTTCELVDVADPYQKSAPLDEYWIGRQGLASEGGLRKVRDKFYVAGYKHRGLYGDHMYGWKSNIFWTHYDFGDIKAYNQKNNFFSGDLVMSFDIAQNPLPNFQTQAGDSLTKNFDYISISYAIVTKNVVGHLDTSAPDIVGITPRDYEAPERSELGDLEKLGGTEVRLTYDPNINLEIHPEHLVSYDAGIVPHTVGSTMNPKSKDGSPIWNPQSEQKSMKDARIIYNVPSFSPLVREYYGSLSYDFKYCVTKDEYYFLLTFLPELKYCTSKKDVTYTMPVALHVTNRYIQAELRIEFDIFASYQIDVGADGIEDFDLEFPTEYYDLLTWLTTVDGFGAGEQHTEGYAPFGDYSTWIIIGIVVVAIVVLYITLKFGTSWWRAYQHRKALELALKTKK